MKPYRCRLCERLFVDDTPEVCKEEEFAYHFPGAVREKDTSVCDKCWTEIVKPFLDEAPVCPL